MREEKTQKKCFSGETFFLNNLHVSYVFLKLSLV